MSANLKNNAWQLEQLESHSVTSEDITRGVDHALDTQVLKLNAICKSACFATGTLVHTDKGLKPIQDIRVGDMVLSMPENGVAEKAYKKVLTTIKTPNQHVFRCTFWARDQYDLPNPTISYVIATKNHPIWNLSEEAWRPATEMRIGDAVYVLKESKVNYHFLYANQLYQTHNSQGELYGFCDIPLEIADSSRVDSIFELNENHIIAYKKGVIQRNNYVPNNGIELEFKDKVDITQYASDVILLTDVYNIEVEDYHTYFVGEEGLWVHDMSCGM